MIVNKYNINTYTTDHLLFGIYSGAPAHLLPMNLDLYYLGADNEDSEFQRHLRTREAT